MRDFFIQFAPFWKSGAGVFVLDVVVKATLLLAAAYLAAMVLGKASAAVRHRIWCLMFMSLLVLPFASWLLPGWRLPILPYSAETPVSAIATPVRTIAAVASDVVKPYEPPTMEHPIGDAHRQAVDDAPTGDALPKPKNSASAAGATAIESQGLRASIASATLPPTTIPVFWLIGLGVALLPMAASFLRTFLLGRSARLLEDAEPRRLFQELCRTLGVKRSVGLLESEDRVIPMTWGLWRPVILLPRGWRAWSPQRRRIVLLHELAHIKRWDIGYQLLARLACAVYWFHPLAWHALRRMRIERELACDDYVLIAGERSTDYAEQLLEIAKDCQAPAWSAAAVAMAHSSKLEHRVRALLSQAHSHLPISRGTGRVILSGSVVLLACVAFLGPARMAEKAMGKSPEVSSSAAAVQGAAAADPLPAGAVVRLGTSRYRYGSPIGSMRVSADGKLAIVSSGVAWFSGLNAPTLVFDLTDGRCLHSLPDAEAVGLSPDGKTLATKDAGAVHFWDATTGKELRKHVYMTDAGGGRSGTDWITFTPDGKQVAVTLLEHAVQLIDVETAKVIRTFAPSAAVTACVFSPDGKLMATGGYENEAGGYSARLWEVGTGKEVRRFVAGDFPAGNGAHRSLAFSPDGKTLAGGGWGDVRLHVWETATGKEPIEFPKLGGNVGSVAFAPDGKTVAAVADGIHLYDPATGKERLRIESSAGGLTFSQDSSVLTGAVSGAIYRWDAANGRRLAPSAGQDSAVEQILVHADSRQVLTTDLDGNLFAWDAAGDASPRRIAGAGRGFVASPDGRYLAWTVPGVYGGSRVQLYDLAAKRVIDRPANTGSYLAFMPDGKTILTVGIQPATVQLWDLETEKELRSFEAGAPKAAEDLRNTSESPPYETNRRITLSRDGKMLAIGPEYPEGFVAEDGDAPVRLWDVGTGKPGPKLDKPIKLATESDKAGSPTPRTYISDRRWHSRRLPSIDGRAFSPDGRLLADWAEHPFEPSQIDHVYVWDVTTGRAVATLDAGPRHGAENAAFSPDGRTLATVLADGVVRLWDTTTWKVRAELRGHRDRVTALAFGPDGRLYTGGLDTVVLGWDVQSLEPAVGGNPPATKVEDDSGGSRKSADDGKKKDENKDEKTDSTRYEFRGEVVDPEKKPIAGAKIFFSYWIQNAPLDFVAKPLAVTDNEGKFEFTTTESGGVIIAAADGYGFAADSGTKYETTGNLLKTLPVEAKAFWALQLANPKRVLQLVRDDTPISARVMTAEGKPVVGARVKVNQVWINRNFLTGAEGDLEAFEKASKDKKVDFYSLRKTAEFGLNGPHLPFIVPDATTDEDGRFVLRGVGRERVVELMVSGPGIETKMIYARTRKGDPIVVTQSWRDSDHPLMPKDTFYGAEFDYKSAPSKPIVGRVTDAETGKPIAGALVNAGQEGMFFRSGLPWIATMTDADGRYRLEGMPIGKRNALNAFPPASTAFLPAGSNLSTEGDAPSLTHDFPLKQGIWLRGQVIDDRTKKPVAGRIKYSAFRDNKFLKSFPAFAKGSISHERRVEDDGRFKIPVMPGSGLIMFTAMDHTQYRRGLGAEAITGPSEMIPTVMAKPTKVFETVSEYVSADNEHVLRQINLEEGAKLDEMTLMLTSGVDVTGYVLDPEGKRLSDVLANGNIQQAWYPITGEEIRVEGYYPDRPRKLFFYDPAHDLAGFYRLEGPPPQELKVTLQPAGSLSGRLLNSQGAPWPGIKLSGEGVPGEDYGNTALRLETDEDGRFLIRGLVPGRKYSIVGMSDRIWGVLKDQTVEAGKTKDVGDVKLDPKTSE
jgi:WD40 repeat protein/beta-lactamase regulating signal transducer with metallopeptidase domain